MVKVKSLKEAEQWFLNNHSGSIMCVSCSDSREVNSYPQACKFFKEQEGER